ncbi:DUF2339 domain-containing protein [Yoonia sediminilitoris]|uniref:Putative membrane protein n=1 Tax=Yoonia sediminilitoris TaxID=1286148 RepID=A0A2T6KIQ3_9RHOB|nr:DUF2339 domain-containing protein [Yoonia sediminilitoris]PUB15599.1 putative membrane protein [Yoonia sediminilitoris]RCW96208.1 putative membrane protein [Yoonia sediminilitoris]
MESLLVFVALVILAIPVAVIYLLISNAGLRGRVAALEAQLAGAPDAPRKAPEPPPEIAEQPAKPSPPVAIAAKAPAPAQPTEGPPKAVVVHRANLQKLMHWIVQNWFYVVSAMSLALAGIFLVLYGIEQGYLPPVVRVLAAFAFGAVLIAAGEYIRRRFGDTEDSSTAYLPSTFSGAGVVTLFGAVLAARLLYDFIGPEVALVGMALVGAVALVLGWFYGPLLASVGVIGAMGAPFVIGGSSDSPAGLFAYFAIVTIVGLAIDTLRRWAWVSVIALTLGFGAGVMLMLGSAMIAETYFVMYCAVLVLAAIAIPVRRLVPDHAGTLLSLSLFARKKGEPWPEFPTRLAGGAVLAASVLILLTAFDVGRADVFWTSVAVLSGMVLALLIWARNAPALIDLAILPAAALVAIIAGADWVWTVQATAAEVPEADMPLLPTSMIVIGMALSVAAAWRSLQGGSARLFVAAGAAICAPAIAIVVEAFWHPADTLGPYVWALHAMVIAALMVGMAERFARADGPGDRQRMSFAVLSALASIAFGVIILFSSAALTVAFAVTVVAAAWLDRQFNLPLMGIYILAGITTIGYRLIINPGLDWAFAAPVAEMLLAHGGAAVAFVVSWGFARAAKRPRTLVLLESAVFTSIAILLSLLLFRAIEYWGTEVDSFSHWALGLGATIWIMLGMGQWRRLQIGGPLFVVRAAFGTIFLLIGMVQLGLAVSVMNPLFALVGDSVLGPPVLNTLIPAYLLPGVVFAVGARWLHALPRLITLGFNAVAVALATLWLGLTIRHYWRGSAGMELPDIGQPELYSYTVALLVIGAGLFYQSLARQSAVLRKAGLLVIGLAVAKVFVVDISGLGGLIRVFSLLGLGLALAGLAWLNRWAVLRGDQSPTS